MSPMAFIWSHFVKARHPIFLLICLLLFCLNLRGMMYAADPLTPKIEAALNLSLEKSSFFAVLPLFCLGLAAPFSSRLSHSIAPEYLLPLSFIVYLMGLGIRSFGGVGGLYVGTIILGLSAGLSGSIITSLVKKNFPKQAPLFMSWYTTLIGLGMILYEGTARWLEHFFHSWKLALCGGAPLIIITLLLWLLSLNIQGPHDKPKPLPTHIWPLVHDKLAWYVALFYTLRVASSYIAALWLPILLTTRGISVILDGHFTMTILLAQIPAFLLSHYLVKTFGSIQHTIAFFMGCEIVGFTGALYAPTSFLWPWIILLGIGNGGNFTLGSSLIVLRSKNETQATELSGFSLGLGFCLGGLLTLSLELFSPEMGNFYHITLYYILFCLLAIGFGYLSSQKKYILTPDKKEKKNL